MFKLREIQKSDLEIINKWRNDNSLIDNLGSPFRYINIDVDYEWYEHYLKNRNNNVRCAIVSINDEKKILGVVSITNIDFVNRCAEFHIMIGDKENRGKGLGYFATLEMLNHAFCNLNLNRVELGVLETNLIAQKLYEKVGFKKEGIKRNAIYKNGGFLNLIMMAILKDEFMNFYKR